MFKLFVIATKGDRPEQLKKAIDSIRDQVDMVLVHDNSVEKDLTDNAKFLYVNLLPDPCYYFTGDDDIIYPKDYIERTMQEIDENNCIISWHGRVLNPDADKYYSEMHKGMRYFQGSTEYLTLDVGGTGVMGFKTDYFKPFIAFSEYNRMSDLVLSLQAARQGKAILSPPKKYKWINGQEVKSSIFTEEKGASQSNQIKLMKQILECKNG